MFIEERHNEILNLLHKKGKVNVKDLSQIFDVSESMIRKDLQALEKEGQLKRTYGGALLIGRSIVGGKYFTQRLQTNIEAKEKIAEKAFQLITDQDVVFLDVSSTSYLLAKILINSEKNITIITNMPILSSMISSNSMQKFIFIGGDYNLKVGGNIGSFSIDQISKYRCSKSFIGCSGFDLTNGTVTVSNSEDAYTKKAIMQISKESYLFVPNEYLQKDGLHNFSNIDDYKGIILNSSPDNDALEMLEQHDVQII